MPLEPSSARRVKVDLGGLLRQVENATPLETLTCATLLTCAAVQRTAEVETNLHEATLAHSTSRRRHIDLAATLPLLASPRNLGETEVGNVSRVGMARTSSCLTSATPDAERVARCAGRPGGNRERAPFFGLEPATQQLTAARVEVLK